MILVVYNSGMNFLRRLEMIDLEQSIYGLTLCSVIGTLVHTSLPKAIYIPSLIYPWTFVLSTFSNPDGGSLVITIGAMLITRKFFEGMVDSKEYISLWLIGGFLANLFSAILVKSSGIPYEQAYGIGGTFFPWILGAGVAHFNGSQVVSLYHGIVKVELRELAPLFFLWILFSSINLGGYGSLQAGRSLAGLVALGWFRRAEIRELFFLNRPAFS